MPGTLRFSFRLAVCLPVALFCLCFGMPVFACKGAPSARMSFHMPEEVKLLAEDGVEADLKAGEAGDVDAQIRMGQRYGYGIGVAADRRESFNWFLKAAEAGSAQGQFMVGQAYFMGRGVAPDTEKAFEWHARAAEKGHALAAFAVGMAYASGWGVAPDCMAAARWFMQAEKDGVSFARRQLEWLNEGRAPCLFGVGKK